MPDILIGLAGSLAIAGLAYRKRSLSASGAAAAVLVGTVLYTLGDAVWFGIMIAFFVSSTLLTKWKQHRKAAAENLYQKSGRRDAGQVIANGGPGALMCAVGSIWPETAPWALAAYLGIMATVTADTWATEIGGLSRKQPRSILTWRPVPPGTSGGVTPLGWLAAASGGLFIGGTGLLLMQLVSIPSGAAMEHLASSQKIWWVAIAAASGWVGANADSLLGAVCQAMYRCRVCGKETEARTHCGTPSKPVRGLPWMDNDAVNLISSLVGGTVCLEILRALNLF